MSIRKDYTPQEEKKLRRIMLSSKGTKRKVSLEKFANSTKRKFSAVQAKAYAIAAKKTLVKDTSGSMRAATVTTNQVRVKYKSVNVDFTTNELVFTI